MGKRSKSGSTAIEPVLVVDSKRVNNKKVESECSDANNESNTKEIIMGTIPEDKQAKRKRKNKTQSTQSDASYESRPEETIVTPEPSEVNKQAKRKRKNKTQSTETGNVNKNKKIIFKDDDDEPVEVHNAPIQRKRTNQQENEEDIKDEDIDKFCDELDEEDNEQYENWVKLIEAKLNPNKKKPK